MKITPKLGGWILFSLVAFHSINNLAKSHDEWEALLKAQRQNNYQVTTSQQQWSELEPFREKWGQYFEKEQGESASRHELFKRLKLEQSNLTPSITKIVSSESALVSHNGLPTDLSKTCVGNTPQGLIVKAGNIKEMIHGLQRLRNRQSVTFSDLTLLNKKGHPEVIIRDLCVLFRLEGES